MSIRRTLLAATSLLYFACSNAQTDNSPHIKSYTIISLHKQDTVRTTYLNKEGQITKEYVKDGESWSSSLLPLWVLPHTTVANVPVIYDQQGLPPKFDYHLPLTFKYDRKATKPTVTVTNKAGKVVPYPKDAEPLTYSDKVCNDETCIQYKDAPGMNHNLRGWAELKGWKLKANIRDSKKMNDGDDTDSLSLTYKPDAKQLHIEVARTHLILEEYDNAAPIYTTPFVGIMTEEGYIKGMHQNYVVIDGKVFRLRSSVSNKMEIIKHIQDIADYTYHSNGLPKEIHYTSTRDSVLTAEDVKQFDERGVMTLSKGMMYNNTQEPMTTDTETWVYENGLLVSKKHERHYHNNDTKRTGDRRYSYNEYGHVVEMKTVYDLKEDAPYGYRVVYQYY